jgi:phosphoribosylformylglycinamidine synthase
MTPSSAIYTIGLTYDEMGGSEYYENYHKVVAGIVPRLSLNIDKLNRETILSLVRNKMVSCVHDCSKGGIAITLCEMAMEGKIGFDVNLDLIPNACSRIDNLLFSESQSRFVFATNSPRRVENFLKSVPGLRYAMIGKSYSESAPGRKIIFTKSGSPVIECSIAELEENYNLLPKEMS